MKLWLVCVFISLSLGQLPPAAPDANEGGQSEAVFFEYEPGNFPSGGLGFSNVPPPPPPNGASSSFGSNNSPVLVAPPGFAGFPSTGFGAVPSGPFGAVPPGPFGAVPPSSFGGAFGNSLFPQPTSLPTQSALERFLSDSECKRGCEDRSFVCSTMKRRCERGLKGVITQQLCPRTCGTCEPCPLMAKACVADGSCRNQLSNCVLLAAMGKCVSHSASHWVRRMCPQSCGECLPCPKPTDPGPECSPNCKDSVKQCSQWAMRHQYCNDPTYKPWMEENCMRSCGTCRLCKLPPPPIFKQTEPAKGRSLQIDAARKLSASHNPNLIPIKPRFPQKFSPPRNSFSPSTSERIIKPTEPITPLYVVTTINTQPVTEAVPTLPHHTQEPAVPSVDRLQLLVNATQLATQCVRIHLQSKSLEDRCLDAHNYYRCLHGVKPLQHSQYLASSAQRHAQLLVGEEEPSEAMSSFMSEFKKYQLIEENIGISMEPLKYDVDQATTSWYAESLGHKLNEKADYQTFKHFLRFMREDTFSVGCGMKSEGNRTAVVAHYFTSQMKSEDIIIPEPTKDCQANCSIGSCSSYTDNSSQCKCISSISGATGPVCRAQCVVHCRKPQYLRGPWRNSCEGRRLCSCSYRPNLKRKFPAGAWCI